MGSGQVTATGGEHDTGKRLAPDVQRDRQAIHDRLEKVFAEKNQTDEERYEDLRQWLDADECVLPTDLLVNCYFDWLASNRVVWPFAGGRLQQPLWVLDVFKTIERLDEFYQLKRKLIKPVTITATGPDDALVS